jgi:butyryl-CoA dehydrogenase
MLTTHSAPAGVGEAVDLEGLDARHRQLRSEFREFAIEQLAPLVPLDDEVAPFPLENVQRAAARRYTGILVPTSFGGLGLDNLALSLFLTEVAQICPSTAVTLSVHNSLAASAINDYGSYGLKQRYLARVASGELLGCYALTEAAAGSDAAALETQARRDGEWWVLDGTKLYVTSGDQAQIAIVFARTDRDAPKAHGITAFLVETSQPGIRVGSIENKLGLRQSSTVELILDGCRVPAENQLGELHRGFPLALERLDGGRIGIASQALGLVQAILAELIATFRGFQEVGDPRANDQRRTFNLAALAAEADAARLMILRAARLRDAGQPHSREGAMAKLLATQLANRAARTALWVVGHQASDRNSRLGRLFRDARITELYEGTTEIQKLVIARDLLRTQ